MYNRSLVLGVIIASLIFWILDAIVDINVGGEDETLVESLFILDPQELWMRTCVVTLLVLFGIFVRKQLDIQADILDELGLYKKDLEGIVEERTKKLEEVNLSLIKEIEERKEVEKKLEELATTDCLTLLHNRRKFDEVLECQIEQDKRYQHGLSLISCDIDNFKNINDTYGHHVGDEILVAFAVLLKKSLRDTDIVARWGGEEFIVLIPSKTAQIAEQVAEKMRKSIEEYSFPYIGKVTASFGVTHSLHNDDKAAILSRVDDALYRAKENGRNRIEVIV